MCYSPLPWSVEKLGFIPPLDTVERQGNFLSLIHRLHYIRVSVIRPDVPIISRNNMVSLCIYPGYTFQREFSGWS
jgi:hypothetical protein